jgi:predicted phage-related endonuclease
MNEIARFAITDRASWLARREQDVTASVAAALFGPEVHPYMTPYGLWCLKRGLLTEDSGETSAMRRGRLLEPIALQLLQEEKPEWIIQPHRFYYRDGEQRLGATPDALASRPDVEGTGVVQIKTVGHFAFKKGWRGEDGEVEVPLWIAVQASVEAALTGAKWAAIAAMALGDGGLEMHVADVPLRPGLIVRLRVLVADFWRRVVDNDPYPPDYGKDAATLARVYADDDGGEVDLTGNERALELVEERQRLKTIESAGDAAGKERKPLDTELVHLLGNAARGTLGDGRVITAKTVKRAEYVVKATSYRAIKVKEFKA